MEMQLRLALPRDELSVPVARRILSRSLDVLGVKDSVIADIELALTEACTNVLDYATDSHEYELSAGIDGTACVLEVIDRGAASTADEKGLRDAAAAAEDGRGIQLMRALVDKVTFTSKPQVGTVVHLEKQLEWPEGEVIERLSERSAATEHGPWSEDRTPR